MSQAKPKRRNLKSEDRKKAIVHSAAELVETKGWDHLNMSALARHSSITRQLIHLHFPRLEDLLLETAIYLFRQVEVDTVAAVSGYSEKGANETLRSGAAVTLDLPPGRAKALLKVITTASSEGAEFGGLARQLRHLVSSLWVEPVADAFGIDNEEAKPIAWLLVMAFWGAFHLIDDGDLSKEDAMDKLDWMVNRIMQGTQPGAREDG